MLEEQGEDWDEVTWIAPESWSTATDLISMIADHELGSFIGITPTTIHMQEFQQYFRYISYTRFVNC